MSNLERLVYMANQIARNFEGMNQASAVKATADHLASFWAPRMKAQIFAFAESDQPGLGEVARAAIVRLRDKGPPPSQTHATEFNAVDEGGRSDAG